jgi:drug/metabolite transporter superfamily protein YnfA
MTADPAAPLRRSVYLLLTALAVGIAVAKIVGAELVHEPSRHKPPTQDDYGFGFPNQQSRAWPEKRPNPSPMYGSNDRSRWATVRALVDEGTYVVGRRENKKDTGIIFEDGYQSLDKVMNPDTGEFYSSKPPLFPTLLAGEYWLLKTAFGWDIVRDRWLVVCTILLTVNALPFAVYLVLLSRLIDDYGTTDFGRVFAFAAACGGTFLTTFSATLNNHTPAACCALFAVYPLLRKAGRPASESPGMLFLSGLFAGLTVTFELPAAALLAGLFVPLLWVRPKTALLYFLPGAVLPIAALLATNYLAIGQLVPAYATFGTSWYEYEGSHWLKLKDPAARGIDFARESKWVYAFHLLFGHHGWFSLTPVWLFGAVGLASLTRNGVPAAVRVLRTRAAEVWSFPVFGTMTAAVSIVVFVFYVFQTNNYGGFTSGPRWLFWLTPLWLLGMLPAADRAGRSRLGRGLAAVGLGLSALAAFYPAWNPWRPPWVLQFLEVNGLLVY